MPRSKVNTDKFFLEELHNDITENTTAPKNTW